MFFAEPTEPGEPLGTEHVDSLYRYAVVLTGSRVEADDLVQETYLRALGAFHRLREDSNVRGWLLTILRNLWFNELRKRRRRPQFVDIDAYDNISDGLTVSKCDPERILESKQDVDRVWAALLRLPPPSREILVLREFEELSYVEIASVLDCPAGTVMSRLGRARARLRDLLSV
jgi:RNA polymerase sigma-70 factor (ECF subfamily)